MSSSGPVYRSVVTTSVVWFSLLLGAQCAAAADRVNAMTTYRQGAVQPWQVRPGVSLPVFGNATDTGSMPGDGSAVGDTYTFSFSSNPNVQVTHDGSLTGTVTNDKYIVENVTFELLNGSTREVVAVTLTVDDGAGSVDSETREIDIVDPSDAISDTPLKNLAIEVNIAIQDGLRYLYQTQESNGRWRHGRDGNFDCGTTGFVLWAFANSGHLPVHDYDDDIYAEWVQKGIDYVLSQARAPAFSSQTYIGNPDADGNGRILDLCRGSRPGYSTPIAAAGIIAAYSSAPETVVASGSFAGETYAQVIQDAIDWTAYAQHDGSGAGRGGWRYTANSGADTSVDSWHYVAMEGAEAFFGSTVLELVKQEAERRINSSQSQGGAGDRGQFGYEGTSPAGTDGNATTAGGLSGLVMVNAGGRVAPLLDGGSLSSAVFPDVASRKAAAVAHLGLRWDVSPGTWQGNRGNFYAMWTTARALRLNGTAELVDKNGVTFNWETGEDVTNPGVLPPVNDVHEGYFTYLVRIQAANGSWPQTVNGAYWTQSLNTVWGVLILQPTVFGPPPPSSPPPVALCQDPSIYTDFGLCSADAGVDAGSFDPLGDLLAYLQEPPGPYGLGMTDVTLTVTDGDGQEASCSAVVTVTDPEPPSISCNAPPLISGVAGASYSFTATAGDNCDPSSDLVVEISSATCFDDDEDDDGVPDDEDECPGSDTSDEVVIAECVTGVFNVLFPSGCTINDLILACGEEARNHGDFVSCVAHLTNALKDDGIITGREKGVIQRCAAQAPIPEDHPGGGHSTAIARKGEVCEVTADGGTVSFPDGPNSGYLEWTVTATDSSGNTTSETCTVVIQDPDTPLPNLAPVADAGPDQVVPGGAAVALDGSGSTDLNGDALTYQWTLTSVPAGSTAVLSDPSAVAPTFFADAAGVFVAQLVVSDGVAASAPDAVSIVVLNGRPIADAGGDQTAFMDDEVQLDGTGSSDPEGDALTYQWTLAYRPASSAAALDEASAPVASFTADVRGTYVAQLVVSDGKDTSLVDAAIVRVVNRAPVADAGPDQDISVFDVVTLDGSGSSDADGDPLTYSWSAVSLPSGSTATLSDAASAQPSFQADLAGTYVFSLVVDDGFEESAPDTVSIVTVNTPPVADAGADQTAFFGDTVTLDGSGSSDVDGDSLTYQWSFAARPVGSTATLSDPTAVNPSFVVDAGGIFVLQLVAHDGQRPSVPDFVSVTIRNSAPVADAGPDRTVFVGDTVMLDGSGSYDVDGDPLAYAWTLTSVPAGSGATLSDPSSVTPSFVPDVAGFYVAELVVSDGEYASAPDSVTLEAVLVPVPDVVGLQQAAAEGVLLGAGFTVGTVVEVYSTTVPAGQVMGQKPSGGSEAPRGSAVDLVVSSGTSGSPVMEILVLPETAVLLVGESQAFRAVGIRADGTSVDLSPAVSWMSLDPVVASVDADGVALALAEGVTSVVATFEAASGSAELTVVSVVDDGEAPVAEITFPAADSTLTSPVDVVGTADDANLLKYELAFSPAGEDAFTTIGAGTSPVVGGVLGSFDPTLLLNGLYDVRLRVYDRGGLVSEASVVYGVEGDQKVGNFSMVFTDVNIPVAGLPVTVERVYDSRDKQRGDFGFGWRLGVQTFTFQTNRLQGTGWEQKNVGTILPIFALLATAEHRVTVVLPNGRTEEFDLTPQPNESVLIPLQTTTAFYSARSGTLGTLEPLGNRNLRVGGEIIGVVELIDSSTNRPYDPQRFEYTAVDGTVYVLDKTHGVELVREPNGNTVTFSAAGILHSTGTGIAFDRDALGRVTRIVDPNGNVQTYAYDANGDLVAHTDSEGNVTQFRYNLSHGLLEIEDPLGQVGLRYEYDDDGRLVATVDAEGHRVELSYDVDGRQQVITDRLGNVTVLTYDENGNVLVSTDALGNATSYTYDADGNELTVTDALGNTISRTYDDRGNALTETNPLGSTVTRTFNSFSQVLTQTDANGNTVAVTYDANGNPLTETDRLGNTLSSVYDAGGRRISSTDALGNTLTYDYDSMGNSTRYVDLGGHETLYTYDANGNQLTETTSRTTETGSLVTMTTSWSYDGNNRIVEEVDPLGNRFRTEYTANGLEAATVDKNGNRTRREYNARGDLVRTLYADGTQESSTYDAEGNRASSTNQAGHTTTYEYDALNRLVRTVYPDTSSVQKEYDAVGRETARIDENGHATFYEYDAAGRRVGVLDPLGNATTYSYDANGNQVSMTDALGNVTQFEYDAENRLTRTLFPDGTSTAVAYDALGRKVEETDQAGNVVHFTYDAVGNLIRVTDALAGETTYTYDEAGNRVSTTDANGNTTRWSYDSLGRALSHTLPLGMRESFTYDANGNQLSHTDFNGDTVTFAYDAADRMVRKTYPDGSEVLWTYTPGGQVATVTDSRGTTTNSYDLRDRLTQVTHPDGTTVSYTYDAVGNRTSVTTPVGTTTYAYDALNRLMTVIAPGGGVTSYAYDAEGNRSSVTRPNGTSAEYLYDELDRLTRLTHRRAGGGVLSDYSYTLGPTGSYDHVSEDSGRSFDFTYDPLRRLTGEVITEPGGSTTAIGYTYDPVGNRLSRTAGATVDTYSYDANNRLLTGAGTTYTYDANGNVIQEAGPGGILSYGYDPENRLIIADTEDPATGVVEYVYDALGNRVRSVVDGTLVVEYLVDTNRSLAQILLETDGAGNVLASYVYGNDLLSMTRSGDTFYYHYDGQLNTRQLSDVAGFVTDTYTFGAFGELLDSTGSTRNDYLYTGQQLDPNTGLYYLRARYYDPSTGRFQSMDPFSGILYEPLSLHKYLYAQADPVNNYDPTGLLFATRAIQGETVLAPTLPALNIGGKTLFFTLLKTAAAVCVASLPLNTFTFVDISFGACDPTSVNTFHPAADHWEATQHVVEALLTHPQWAALQRKSGDPHSRTWLANDPRCNRAANGVTGSVDCDEYPFASTVQGGQANNPSLKLISRSHNRGQGSKLRWFYVACDVKKGDPKEGAFVVAPMPASPVTFWSCD